jgi:hypothetical protein
MSEVGLIYEEKHYSFINCGSEVYHQFMRRWLKERKSRMTRIKKADYRWYRLTKGHHIRDFDIYR